MKILVANIGSTSLKWRLFDFSNNGERLLHKGGFERVTGIDGESQWVVLLNGLQEKLIVSRRQQEIVREFGKHLK